ncbi:MAG: peroxiredoxin [bacterium]|nr:peroxiredoxin [bacterium]
MQIHLIAPDQQEKHLSFGELLAQADKTLLFFYPKDNTPGCSLEAMDFAQAVSTFAQQGIQVVGVSRDSSSSHCKFMTAKGLTFPLISDPELLLHKHYGARGEKKNYGKTFEGTIRSTFLLDQQGTILQERRNVKATGHVARLKKELGID